MMSFALYLRYKYTDSQNGLNKISSMQHPPPPPPFPQIAITLTDRSPSNVSKVGKLFKNALSVRKKNGKK